MLVFVAVIMFAAPCVSAPVLAAVPGAPAAVLRQALRLAAMARAAPVAVLLPLLMVQLAAAAPPTAPTVAVLVFVWVALVDWRTAVPRTELR